MQYQLLRQIVPDASGRPQEVIIYVPVETPPALHNPSAPFPSFPPPRVVESYESAPRSIRPRRRRSKRPRSIASKLALYFVLSWVPVGFGLPGGTLLAWGFIVVWLTREATLGE